MLMHTGGRTLLASLPLLFLVGFSVFHVRPSVFRFFFSLSWRSVSLNLLPPGVTPRFLPALGSNCEMRRPYRIILFFCASRSSTFGGRGRGESAWEEPSPREQGSSRYAPGSRLKRKKTKRNEQTIKQSN